MVEPVPVEGRTDPSRDQDRAGSWGRRLPEVERDSLQPDYRARLASRRASMRVHPSAQSRVIGRSER